MKCPSCADVTLLLSSREGIEIDYCPQCRGVWLDRGELDKIIERTDSGPASRDDEREDRDRKGRDREDRDREDRDRSDRERNDRFDDDDDDDDRRLGGAIAGKKKKRRGFLSEMFEFGD